MLNNTIKEGDNQPIFLYDFYCKHCKKYFSDNDIKRKRINTDNIGYTVLKYCPICNAKDLISICDGCRSGLMEKPLIPDGGDYNEEGKVEPFCTECGEGYRHVIIGFCQIMKKTNLSKRNIRKTIDKVFTHKGLPYNEKKYVQELVFGIQRTESNIVSIISVECQEDETFVREQLRD